MSLCSRLFNSIHTQEGQSCNHLAKATSSGIYPVEQAPANGAGSLLEGLFLALRQRHTNCYLPFPEATVTRTAGDGVKVSRSVQ